MYKVSKICLTKVTVDVLVSTRKSRSNSVNLMRIER